MKDRTTLFTKFPPSSWFQNIGTGPSVLPACILKEVSQANTCSHIRYSHFDLKFLVTFHQGRASDQGAVVPCVLGHEFEEWLHSGRQLLTCAATNMRMDRRIRNDYSQLTLFLLVQGFRYVLERVFAQILLVQLETFRLEGLLELVGFESKELPSDATAEGKAVLLWEAGAGPAGRKRFFDFIRLGVHIKLPVGELAWGSGGRDASEGGKERGPRIVLLSYPRIVEIPDGRLELLDGAMISPTQNSG